MTMRRGRLPRKKVRRAFGSQAAIGTVIGTTIIDQTPQVELGAEADSRTGQLLVTGVAKSSVGESIGRAVVWVGRTSTVPLETDAGARTRDFATNTTGLPFVFRITGLTVRPGDVLKLITRTVTETDNTATHTHIAAFKWAFTEMR